MLVASALSSCAKHPVEASPPTLPPVNEGQILESLAHELEPCFSVREAESTFSITVEPTGQMAHIVLDCISEGHDAMCLRSRVSATRAPPFAGGAISLKLWATHRTPGQTGAFAKLRLVKNEDYFRMFKTRATIGCKSSW